MLTKNELRTLWKKYGFRPKKRLGQNFLVDKNVCDKILRHLNISSDDVVVEIGAGFGELTYALAKTAKSVFAVEKDRRITEILKKNFELPPNVILAEEDILEVDIKSLARNKRIIVYGNLPYYVTSPVMERIFRDTSAIKRAYFIIQKEVGDRIVAVPGTRNMGRLSLYVQYYADPKIMFGIAKESFYPVPKVESVFLKLEMPAGRMVPVKDEEIFFRAIKSAYTQRRKRVLNSLSGTGIAKPVLRGVLNKAKIDPGARAENLYLDDFARLANTIADLR